MPNNKRLRLAATQAAGAAAQKGQATSVTKTRAAKSAAPLAKIAHGNDPPASGKADGLYTLSSFLKKDIAGPQVSEILKLADSVPGFFPFRLFRNEQETLVAADEHELLAWKIKPEEVIKILQSAKKRVKKVRKAATKEQPQEEEENFVEIALDPDADGSQVSPRDSSPSSDSSSDSSSESSSIDDRRKKKKKRNHNVKGGTDSYAAAATSAPGVMITSSRTAWPAEEPLSVSRLNTELQFCRDHQSQGYALPPTGTMIPPAAGTIVELTLAEEIGEEAAANWRKIYEHNPIGLFEQLIRLLPEGGIQKDIVQLMTEVKMRIAPEDASCAREHSHGMAVAVTRWKNEMNGEEEANDQPPLKRLDATTSTSVLKAYREQYAKSSIPFFKHLGKLIFQSPKYGEIPTTVWEFSAKQIRVCKAIAEALELTSKIYPHTVHLLKQGKGSESKPNQAKGEKRKLDHRSPSATTKVESSEPCNACGGKYCAPKQCRLWKHPHANKDAKIAWKDSEWGKIYKNKLNETSSDLLPLDKIAVSAGGGQYKLEKWIKNSSSSSAGKKSYDKKQVSNIANTNVFNFVNGISTFNPLISARNVSNGKILGTGILDSGAFGGHINNYVNQAMVDSLVANGSIAGTCACNSTKVCTITGCIQNSTCVSLKIELFNELGQNATIDTIARVVQGLPYNFIIGLTTIRRYKLATVFDSLFEELEGVSDLFNDDKNITNTGQPTTNNITKDVKTDVYTGTTIAESAIKLPSGRPIVASREHKVDGGLFRQLAACNRPSATPMGGNPSKSVACKCDTKHTLWCVACSTASSQAVEDHRTYSQEVINLVECTTITDNRACAYSERVAMHDFVRTFLTSQQYINSIHSKDEFLDIEDDVDNIDTFVRENPYDKLCSPTTPIDDSELLRAIKIEGTDEFLVKANNLLSQHASRFKSSLTSEAARLKSFELELQPDSTWYTSKKNKLPTRLQSQNKRNATREFVNNALATGLIEPSQAESWSQILLTPKANGKWRFCVDYRFLNKETKSMGWPLPNIKQMLERIGEKKPKFFAVLDLTQGYYQMAISKKTRPLTAFRTSEGLFQFRRLPMGLKSAPAFFQAAMQQTVLAEMLYQICEVYLDDIIVFAETEDELLANLSKIFSRLEQYNITLNPEKVKIGLQSVEYVGHVIDKDGLSFSKEKISDVLATPKPETHKQMKSFLGLCVQFKDHIERYSDIVKPLHLMIPNYKTSTAGQRLKWTPETEACFAELLEKVNTCPKLFFMDESAPVFLHTDASKYGIGGYLFQVVDNVQQPIAFISKTLTSTELRWSVPEKEGYAIFYSLMKLEHLLRDIHFVLRTDHKNLTFINTDFREKVKRWKLAIQHFDFDLEYIKGEANIEADGFSRLCPMPSDPDSIEYLNLLTERLPQDVYTKIQAVHNTNAGHFGVEKTIRKLITSGQRWKGMRKDVKHFVERCNLCQKLSATKLDIQTMPFTLASYSPFDRICVDTIGPLPTNDDSKTHILVIIDAFARFVMLRAIPNTTAKEAIDGLMDWIGMFGIPSQVVSDNGTQFANELVDGLLEILASDNIKIQAYSKEENAIVERANKE